MKELELYEGCIEQTYRLFADRLYTGGEVPLDEEGRIRIDDWEMSPAVQAEVTRLWKLLSTEHMNELTDLEGYRREFFQLFGFENADINYEADTNPEVAIPNLFQ